MNTEETTYHCAVCGEDVACAIGIDTGPPCADCELEQLALIESFGPAFAS